MVQAPAQTVGRSAAPEVDLEKTRQLREQVVQQNQIAQRRRGLWINSMRALFFVLAMGYWEYGSGRWFDAFFVSKPSAIAKAMWIGVTERDMLYHAWLTIYEAVAGYVIGCAVALVLAIVLALARRLYEVMEPFIVAIYGIPRIALAPLFIMWFGIGVTPKVIIAAFMVFFVVFMNTVTGIRSTNRQFIDISRLLGASWWQLLTKVILPSAMPYILTALRIVVPTAMIGAIVGEFISSQRGLGFWISRASFQLNIAGAFAGIMVLLIVILVMNGTVGWIESRLMRWRQDDRTQMEG